MVYYTISTTDYTFHSKTARDSQHFPSHFLLKALIYPNQGISDIQPYRGCSGMYAIEQKHRTENWKHSSKKVTMGEIASSLVGDNVHYLLKALCIVLSLYTEYFPGANYLPASQELITALPSSPKSRLQAPREWLLPLCSPRKSIQQSLTHISVRKRESRDRVASLWQTWEPGLSLPNTPNSPMIHQQYDEFWKVPHATHRCGHSSCHTKELGSRTVKNPVLCFNGTRLCSTSLYVSCMSQTNKQHCPWINLLWFSLIPLPKKLLFKCLKSYWVNNKKFCLQVFQAVK